MAIIAADSGGNGDFTPTPAGNHVGICSMIADLGRQRTQSQMYGEKVKHQVYVAWELPHETISWTDKDGNEKSGPMRIGKIYTLSLHENATLRHDLESWRGRPFTEEERRGFDIAKLAAAPAMVNVVHEERNGKTYANVASVTPLPKGMEKPALADSYLIYDRDENSRTYDHLPEWLQKKVDAQITDEPQPAYAGDDLNDEVPF